MSRRSPQNQNQKLETLVAKYKKLAYHTGWKEIIARTLHDEAAFDSLFLKYERIFSNHISDANSLKQTALALEFKAEWVLVQSFFLAKLKNELISFDHPIKKPANELTSEAHHRATTFMQKLENLFKEIKEIADSAEKMGDKEGKHVFDTALRKANCIYGYHRNTVLIWRSKYREASTQDYAWATFYLRSFILTSNILLTKEELLHRDCRTQKNELGENRASEEIAKTCHITAGACLAYKTAFLTSDDAAYGEQKLYWTEQAYGFITRPPGPQDFNYQKQLVIIREAYASALENSDQKKNPTGKLQARTLYLDNIYLAYDLLEKEQKFSEAGMKALYGSSVSFLYLLYRLPGNKITQATLIEIEPKIAKILKYLTKAPADFKINTDNLAHWLRKSLINQIFLARERKPSQPAAELDSPRRTSRTHSEDDRPPSPAPNTRKRIGSPDDEDLRHNNGYQYIHKRRTVERDGFFDSRGPQFTRTPSPQDERRPHALPQPGMSNNFFDRREGWRDREDQHQFTRRPASPPGMRAGFFGSREGWQRDERSHAPSRTENWEPFNGSQRPPLWRR